MKRFLAVLAFGVFLPLIACGQGTTPGLMPNNTTLCNVTGVSALGTPCQGLTVTTITFVTSAFDGLNDQTAKAGNVTTFWPANGPAIVHRMNRLAVGTAASSNLSPGGNTWADSLSGNFSVLANIMSIGSIFSGINAASRTSDTCAAGIGCPSGGSAGGYFFGYNDDNTVGNIALGTNSVGFSKAGTKGIALGAQQDINCGTTPYASTPASIDNPSGGTCIGELITAGAFSVATTTPSVAMAISNGPSGGGVPLAFAKGIVVASNALDPTQGVGGSGVAFEMYHGQTQRWYDGVTVFAEIGTNNSGLFGINTNSSQWSINGVLTVSCTGINTSTVVVTNGLITHC